MAAARKIRPSSAHFNLSVSPGVARDFDLWRWSVSPMFDIGLRRPEDLADFAFEAMGYHFHDMAIATATSSPTVFSRPAAVIAKSGIDNIMLQVYAQGDYLLDASGVQTEVVAGDIAVIDLSRPGMILADAYTNLTVVLPRQRLTPLIRHMDNLHGLVLRNGKALNTMLKLHMQMLLAEAGSISLAEAPAVAQGTMALVAACVGPAAEAREMAVKSIAATTFQMIRRTIDDRLADPGLNPEVIGAQFGISRASLYRLFEPLGGVRRYILQRRLMRAYQALSDPAQFGDRIAAVARQCGFTNETVFSRAFRDTYRMTARDVRDAARARDTTAVQARERVDSSFLALNRWLLGLETRFE